MKKIFFCLALLTLSHLSNAQLFSWAARMGQSSPFLPDEGTDIVVDPVSGSVYTIGIFSETVDFNPGAGVFNLGSPNYVGGFISKLDQNGNFVWAKSWDLSNTSGNNFSSIALDNAGNIYISGNYGGGTVDFDPDAGVYNLTSTTMSTFIVKLNPAGNFVWAKDFLAASNSVCYANSIAIDASGNVFTSGKFYGTVDFNPSAAVNNYTTPTPNIVTYNTFVSKLDALGNFVWAITIESTSHNEPRSLAIDGLGNPYITGEYNGDADFDPSPTIVNNMGAAKFGSDVFVLKLNATGGFEWVKTWGTINNSEKGMAITTDAQNNVVVTGELDAPIDFDDGPGQAIISGTSGYDLFVLKLNSLGNFIWVRKIGKPIGYVGIITATDIKTDDCDNIYICGNYIAPIDFDSNGPGFVLTPLGYSDIFISRFSSTGQFVWAKSMGGTNFDYSVAMALDANRNIYTTGNFRGTADFDPSTTGTYNLTSAGNRDIFISKLFVQPDFTPQVLGYANHTAGSSYNFIIDVSEIYNNYSSGCPVVVRVPKIDYYTFSYDPSATVMTASGTLFNINNSDWDMTEDATDMYFSLKPGSLIKPWDISIIGMTISLDPNTPSQWISDFCVYIGDTTGGDAAADDNIYCQTICNCK